MKPSPLAKSLALLATCWAPVRTTVSLGSTAVNRC